MSYQIEYRDSGFHLIHRGKISIGEINEVNGEIQGSEHFDDHKYQIIDLLEADFSEICQSHSKMPGATDAVASSRNENVRVALITKEAQAISFCREYIETATQMGSTWDFEIFPDADSALKWAKADL